MDPISNFKGIFARGSEDATPEDHFIDSRNIEFPFGGCDTRKGTELDLTLANIRRKVLYKRINESPRMLILTDGGNLWDSTSLSIPILTIPAMTDFSAAFFYNRAYISPHDGVKGLLNESIRVYDGTTMRVAGGARPVGSMTVANSASSGKIDAGFHIIGLVFESPSGHISKLSYFPGSGLIAEGGKKADVAAIPTGPSGTVRRKFVATRAIPVETYTANPNPEGYEYFFVPTGIINDNVSTTFTGLDFFDSELQDSADYLFSIRETIPAGAVISSFKGKMLVGNIATDTNLLLVSKTNEPETFDEVDDIIVVDPTEAGGVTNAVEHHGILVITKSYRAYTTNDNGAEPSTWEVLPFDKAIGTDVHGIGTILDTNGITIDRFVMASRTGLVLYNGTFQEPELTYKIDNIWKRINQNAFNTVEVAIDPTNKRIYVAVPLDEVTTPSHIIYGDYSDGFSYDLIKWDLWSFPWKPTTIVVDLINNKPILKIGSHDGNIYRKVLTATNDNGAAIDSYIQFALLPQDHSGPVRHYNFFRARITGNGNVQVTTVGRQSNNPQTYNSFALNTNGQDVTRLLNFNGERCSLKLRVSNINESFRLSSFFINYEDLYYYRPA